MLPRFLVTALTAMLLLTASVLLAQNGVASQRGDPPTAALITISPPDDNGVVTITGAAGAVFPGAQVAIRNLYTEEIVYTQAGLTGTFTAQLFGPGNTPFWISPAVSIPNEIRNRPGSLPGGPGTIVFGTATRPPAPPLPVTQLIIDGDAEDWSAYPQGLLLDSGDERVYGLRNSESLYVALDAVPEAYWRLRVEFTLEGATYELSLDPRLVEEAATWRRTAPIEQDLGLLAVATTQADSIEMRIPFDSLAATLGAALEFATLEHLEFLDVEGNALHSIPVAQPLPMVDEIDGRVIPAEAFMDNEIGFTVSGPVAQGEAHWHAVGRVNSLDYAPGERLQLQLDVTLDAPGMPEMLTGLQMIGQLALQPLTDEDGVSMTGGLNSNNGWSAVRTASGMPIDNLRSDFLLAETNTPAPQVLRQDDTLLFTLNFDLELPSDLPEGSYGLILWGYGQVGDGERFRWVDNGLLGTGPGISRAQLTRLPVILNVGDVPDERRLLWSLFVDSPSEGSRGVLAQQDQTNAALSNRIRFNSPSYILRPYVDPASSELRRYPLEPYLISQLPNAYNSSAAPLVPFSLPGGQLNVQITRPDGSVDDLGQVPITQNRLSTFEMDDRSLFGGQSQVDVYQLTTSNPAFRAYEFDQYGPYNIRVQGNVEDLWGNRYQGGGDYNVLVAELLDMTPGVLSGTPFEVGDTFYPGLQIVPSAPADVTITARIYPLNGGRVIEHVIEGRANDYGYFAPPDSAFSFDVPGEYVIDYEARFVDARERLWAGSFRSAGVIASPDAAFIAHGRRGLNDYAADYSPAWFNARAYGPEDEPLHLNYPYHRGDVLWYMADTTNTVQPGLTAQDIVGDYARWMTGAMIDYESPDGTPIDRRAARAELPLVMAHGEASTTDSEAEAVEALNVAYTYLSAVRPGLTLRQYVLGSDDAGLPLYWDMNDPYNQQIGSGLTGDLPGDYVFLFGGAVVRNAQAEVIETSIYAASGIVTDEPDLLGARVLPPYRGQAGATDNGPLMTVNGEAVEMFFHPTSIRPGQILTQGDTLSLAGQIAPTLDSKIRVTVTSPSGSPTEFIGRANAIGYYYDPANDFALDEIGVWTVHVEVWHDGQTSVGPVHEPYPRGGVLGSEGGSFAVYVVPDAAVALEWHDTRQDFAIPGAIPYNFNFSIPADWTNVRVEHTVTSPDYILRSGPLPVSGASFSFQHNPTNLNRVFPQLEIDARLDGPAASDPVILSFTVTGTDANGDMQIRSRMFTILYDRLITLEAVT